MKDDQSLNGAEGASNMNDQPLKLLLVEDNPGDARLIRELLNETKLPCVDLKHAETLTAAVKHLATQATDVIILDLSLPDSKGLETISRIQAQVPQTPVIVLTGLNDEELGLKAVQQGAQDYLVKGHVDGNLLARAVRYAKERMEHQVALSETNRSLATANKELREAQERLVRAEKLATIGQLSAAIAHEIRNPLGTIKNSVYYIGDQLQGSQLLEDDLFISQFLDIMDAEVKRADKTITDLTDFSRTNTRPNDLSTTQLEPILDSALSSTETNGYVKIVKQLPENPPEVLVDGSEMVRAFANLIRNASEAMPDGGTLTITARSCDDMVEIQFTDTGCGMPEDHLSKVFDPLYTTKPRGMGLGLAIVNSIIERHSGSIHVVSQENKGTTFSVQIPAAR